MSSARDEELRMETLAVLRRSSILLVVLAIVAGCATPSESGAPVDNNQDGDQDGIIDGKSPEQGEPSADAGNSSVEQNGTTMPDGSYVPPTTLP